MTSWDEAAERGYVRCRCGTVYARRLGGIEDQCCVRPCSMSARDMRPISQDDAERIVPRGATIIVLTTRSETER